MTWDSCAAASAPAGHRGDGLENIACNIGLLTCENRGLIDGQILYFHIFKYCLHGKCEFYTVFRVDVILFLFFKIMKNEFAILVCIVITSYIHVGHARELLKLSQGNYPL